MRMIDRERAGDTDISVVGIGIADTDQIAAGIDQPGRGDDAAKIMHIAAVEIERRARRRHHLIARLR